LGPHLNPQTGHSGMACNLSHMGGISRMTLVWSWTCAKLWELIRKKTRAQRDFRVTQVIELLPSVKPWVQTVEPPKKLLKLSLGI
jgi:hypothetical protein